jgi:hypothetical protein
MNLSAQCFVGAAILYTISCDSELSKLCIFGVAVGLVFHGTFGIAT